MKNLDEFKRKIVELKLDDETINATLADPQENRLSSDLFIVAVHEAARREEMRKQRRRRERWQRKVRRRH